MRPVAHPPRGIAYSHGQRAGGLADAERAERAGGLRAHAPVAIGQERQQHGHGMPTQRACHVQAHLGARMRRQLPDAGQRVGAGHGAGRVDPGVERLGRGVGQQTREQGRRNHSRMARQGRELVGLHGVLAPWQAVELDVHELPAQARGRVDGHEAHGRIDVVEQRGDQSLVGVAADD